MAFIMEYYFNIFGTIMAFILEHYFHIFWNHTYIDAYKSCCFIQHHSCALQPCCCIELQCIHSHCGKFYFVQIDHHLFIYVKLIDSYFPFPIISNAIVNILFCCCSKGVFLFFSYFKNCAHSVIQALHLLTGDFFIGSQFTFK